MELESFCEKHYMRIDKLDEMLSEYTKRATVRERHAESLIRKMEDFQTHLETTLSKTCDKVITQKLIEYEKVSVSFGQFFNAEDLRDRLAEKINIKEFEEFANKQA